MNQFNSNTQFSIHKRKDDLPSYEDVIAKPPDYNSIDKLIFQNEQNCLSKTRIINKSETINERFNGHPESSNQEHLCQIDDNLEHESINILENINSTGILRSNNNQYYSNIQINEQQNINNDQIISNFCCLTFNSNSCNQDDIWSLCCLIINIALFFFQYIILL